MKKRKGLFSKIIVVFCILEITFMQVWAMYISKTIMTTELLVVNHGVFGGELLLLCLKRILKSNGGE